MNNFQRMVTSRLLLKRTIVCLGIVFMTIFSGPTQAKASLVVTKGSTNCCPPGMLACAMPPCKTSTATTATQSQPTSPVAPSATKSSQPKSTSTKSSIYPTAGDPCDWKIITYGYDSKPSKGHTPVFTRLFCRSDGKLHTLLK